MSINGLNGSLLYGILCAGRTCLDKPGIRTPGCPGRGRVQFNRAVGTLVHCSDTVPGEGVGGRRRFCACAAKVVFGGVWSLRRELSGVGIGILRPPFTVVVGEGELAAAVLSVAGLYRDSFNKRTLFFPPEVH